MVTAQVPALNNDERRAASQKAVAYRQRRAEIRAQLKAGSVSIADVLEMDDEAIKRLPVRLLLCSLPFVGKVKAEKIMDSLGISNSRRVGGLGKHQKEALCEFDRNRRKAALSK